MKIGRPIINPVREPDMSKNLLIKSIKLILSETLRIAVPKGISATKPDIVSKRRYIFANMISPNNQ
jgi:hypothetical protein